MSSIPALVTPIQQIGIQSKATGVDLFSAPVLSPYPALHSVPIPMKSRCVLRGHLIRLLNVG